MEDAVLWCLLVRLVRWSCCTDVSRVLNCKGKLSSVLVSFISCAIMCKFLYFILSVFWFVFCFPSFRLSYWRINVSVKYIRWQWNSNQLSQPPEEFTEGTSSVCPADADGLESDNEAPLLYHPCVGCLGTAIVLASTKTLRSVCLCLKPVFCQYSHYHFILNVSITSILLLLMYT